MAIRALSSPPLKGQRYSFSSAFEEEEEPSESAPTVSLKGMEPVGTEAARAGIFASESIGARSRSQKLIDNGLPAFNSGVDTSPRGWLESHPWMKRTLEDVSKTALTPLLGPVAPVISTKAGRELVAEGAKATGRAAIRTAATPLKVLGAELAGLRDDEEERARRLAPIQTPFGEVKFPSAAPGDIERAGTMTPGEGAKAALESTALLPTGLGVAAGAKALPQVSKTAAKATMRKVIPILTNIPKEDIVWAEQHAEKILPKMKVIMDSEPAAAESILRGSLLKNTEQVYTKAKEAAQTAYRSGIETLMAKYSNRTIDMKALRKQAATIEKESLRPLNQDAVTALEAVKETLRGKPSSLDIKQAIELKDDLLDVLKQTDENTPAYRVADKMVRSIDRSINTATNDAFIKVNAPYAAFKNMEKQVRPVWSRNVTEDTARNFVFSLENQARGGSRDALLGLEKLAGISDEMSLINEIRSAKLAKKMSAEAAAPGSRMRDILVSLPFIGLGTSVGSAFGGFGAAAGGTLGAILGAKATSPRALSKMIFDKRLRDAYLLGK